MRKTTPSKAVDSLRAVPLFLLLLFLAGLPMVLSGCSNITLTDEMELLQAPMLNLEQKAVYEALEATLDTSEIIYHSPKEGEHRTPFAFFDLNGDDKEEAIVFYSEKSDPTAIFAKILQQNEKGEWYSYRDLAGYGDQVSFVEFVPMIELEHHCLIIGWQSSDDPRSKHIGVYSIFKDDQKLGLQEKDILEPFEEYNLGDYDGDGLHDLLITRKNLQNNYELVLIKEQQGVLALVDTQPLNPHTFTVIQMLKGNLQGSRHAVYVDQRLQETGGSGIGVFYATEIFEVAGNQLVPLAMYSEEAEAVANSPEDEKTHVSSQELEVFQNYEDTYRWENMLSEDLWDKGIVCIPRMENLPGQKDSDDKRQIRLTQYRRLTPTGFTTLYNTVVNSEDGYLILLPERWMGNIVVEQQTDRREWRIHKLNHETGDPSTELFRVRLHRAGDFIDPSAETDLLLAQRGAFTYYGFVPEIPGEPLAITEEEAYQLFSLLQ